MSKTEQTDRLTKLLKPDVVINLDKKVVTPFDLLQLQTQLNQISDALAIKAVIDEVIAEYPGPAQDYRDGKQKALGFLVGRVMKATQGKANPQRVNQLLKQKLVTEALRPAASVSGVMIAEIAPMGQQLTTCQSVIGASTGEVCNEHDE